MRRTRVRLLLALGFATFVGAVVLGWVNGQSPKQVATAKGPVDAAFAGTAVSSTKATSSPEKMFGYARPVRVSPLRTMRAR
jgi:hypothetical protein